MRVAPFEEGAVHAVAGGAGYAMWLAPGVHSDDDGIAKLLRRWVPDARQPEIFDLIEQMDSY
jgi:hypothetical protein